MDLKLLKYASERVPELNSGIMEGVATIQIKKVEHCIDWWLRCSAKGYPERIKYLGGRRATPMETFHEMTKSNTSTRIFDMARSDVYLMRYDFTLDGVKLNPRYIFLPFISDGSLMYIRDTQYSVTPVISGRVFNIEQNTIYLPSARLRMGFWQVNVSCIANDTVLNQSAVGSHLYVIKHKTARSTLKPLLVHYILAKWGLKETLRLYNLDAIVGNEELDKLDKSKWFVFKSVRHVSLGKFIDEVPTVRIAISVETYYTLASNIIASIFYIMDNVTEATSRLDELDDPTLWLRVLDFFIFKERCGEQKLRERMLSHIESMESTIDSITIDTFKRADINCDNIFELFRHLTINFQDMCVHYDYGTLYDLQLNTIEPMTFGLRKDIFNTMYLLQKTPAANINVKKVNLILARNLKRNRVLEWKGHGELEASSVASTCMLYGPTANVITHRKATRASTKGQVNLNDPGLLLHPSLLEIANIHACTGKDPTGRGILNPYQKLDKGHVTVQAIKNKDTLDIISNLFKRG